MKKPIYIEEPVKRGKCECCGDIEWLFRDGKRSICGECKQDKEFIESVKGKDAKPIDPQEVAKLVKIPTIEKVVERIEVQQPIIKNEIKEDTERGAIARYFKLAYDSLTK